MSEAVIVVLIFVLAGVFAAAWPRARRPLAAGALAAGALAAGALLHRAGGARGVTGGGPGKTKGPGPDDGPKKPERVKRTGLPKRKRVAAREWIEAQRARTGRVAEIYTPAEKAAIRAVACTVAPAPPAQLADIGGRLPYVPDRKLSGVAHFQLHLGQRKLLLALVDFLTRKGGLSANVVYAGSSPGFYFRYVLRLFPRHRFWLIDPAPFGWKNLPRISYSQSFFTDETAEAFRDKFGGDVLFLSDIRLGGRGFAAFEAAVDADNRKQARWVETMGARAASLKFRIPFTAAGPYPYLAGAVRLQAWAPKASSETRLEVTRRPAPPHYPRRDYDQRDYEEAFAYHNTVTRDWAFHGHGAPPGSAPGLDHCYDCAREVGIWRAYLEAGVGGAGAPTTLRGLMAGAAEATQQSLARPPHGRDPDKFMPSRRLGMVPPGVRKLLPAEEITVCACRFEPGPSPA